MEVLASEEYIVFLIVTAISIDIGDNYKEIKNKLKKGFFIREEK